MADVYCTDLDLLRVVPDLGDFDGKRVVEGFQLVSGTTYKAFDVGLVAVLYRQGQDLGAAQASAAEVLSDGEWHYDAATDCLTVVSTNDPNTYWRYHAAREDWQAQTLEARQEASDFVRSYVNKPIHRLVADGSASGREWPAAVVRATATYACWLLIARAAPERAALLKLELIDRENRDGLLQMLKSGELALPDETTARQVSGVVVSQTVDATTTGTVLDVTGDASVDHDLVKLEILAGGTLAKGTASTVTYRVLGKNATGQQVETLLTGQAATGGRDPLAYGTSVVFAPGDYVAGDAWEIELSGEPPEAGETPRMAILEMGRS